MQQISTRERTVLRFGFGQRRADVPSGLDQPSSPSDRAPDERLHDSANVRHVRTAANSRGPRASISHDVPGSRRRSSRRPRWCDATASRTAVRAGCRHLAEASGPHHAFPARATDVRAARFAARAARARRRRVATLDQARFSPVTARSSPGLRVGRAPAAAGRIVRVAARASLATSAERAASAADRLRTSISALDVDSRRDTRRLPRSAEP